MSKAAQRRRWLAWERYRARYGRRYGFHRAHRWRYEREWRQTDGRLWLARWF